MTDINGFDNEYKFINYLNAKRISELNPLFRNLIYDLYGYLDDNFVYMLGVIICHRNLIFLLK